MMKLVQTQAHKIKDQSFDNWETEVEGNWTIEELRRDEGYCNDWISFDCLAWDDKTQQLYIGLTSINNDIFYVFDPLSKTFTSLNFQSIADRYDAKFHRSLEIDLDGSILAATALLHDMDQQHLAKGGKLVKYDPGRKSYDLLGIPVEHQYIQSICLDRNRRIIYGFTYPAEYLFCYDLEKEESRLLAYIGNSALMCQPHCATLDQYGRLWGTWGESRAFEDQLGPVPVRIFCYDPEQDQFTWFKHGFPKVHESDPSRVDHMFLANDHLIYVGTVAGGFSRLDPDTGLVEDLGKPFQGARLAGLMQGPGSLIYGAGNAGYGVDGKGEARLFAFHPITKVIEDLGPIFDDELGTGAVKVHMMVSGGNGTIFIGENDNIFRSSYLWECKLAE
jgi:hypothetical protein